MLCKVSGLILQVGVGAGPLLVVSVSAPLRVEPEEVRLLCLLRAVVDREGVSLCDVVCCSGIGNSCGPRPSVLGGGGGKRL